MQSCGFVVFFFVYHVFAHICLMQLCAKLFIFVLAMLWVLVSLAHMWVLSLWVRSEVVFLVFLVCFCSGRVFSGEFRYFLLFLVGALLIAFVFRACSPVYPVLFRRLCVWFGHMVLVSFFALSCFFALWAFLLCPSVFLVVLWWLFWSRLLIWRWCLLVVFLNQLCGVVCIYCVFFLFVWM